MRPFQAVIIFFTYDLEYWSKLSHFLWTLPNVHSAYRILYDAHCKLHNAPSHADHCRVSKSGGRWDTSPLKIFLMLRKILLLYAKLKKLHFLPDFYRFCKKYLCFFILFHISLRKRLSTTFLSHHKKLLLESLHHCLQEVNHEHTVHCILYTLHCTLNNAQFNLHTA